MSRLKQLYQVLAIFTLTVCTPLTGHTQDAEWHSIQSPNGTIALSAGLDKGRLHYEVTYKERPILTPSALGISFKQQPSLLDGFTLIDARTRTFRESWTQPWGEQADTDNHYRELVLEVQETAAPKRQMKVVFRVFDDGIGFRYDLPAQENLSEFVISEEHTEFVFAQNYKAWWIPAYRDQRYEYQYAQSALSSLNVVHTPLTLEGDGVTLVVHEAALVDYASMALRMPTDNSKTLVTDLVPWANGDKVYGKAPLQTPWRTIQIAETPSDLIASPLLLNLNEPSQLSDTEWIKPGKYMGIWWEMHTGLKSWSPGDDQGATTQRAREYIDFAARHGIDGVLVEGWNKGWEGDWWQRKPTFDFTKSVEGFDLEAVADYARERGVNIVGHHETAAGIQYYEERMTDAFDYYQSLGIDSVKTGYVGTRLDGKEWHHGQYMVRHFDRVIREAAKHKIMVNAHEPIKATGRRRTWPNMMTREGARGMEYNGGSPDTGNLPDHTTILPFTRLMAGPFDYNSGIFEFDYQDTRPINRVPTTLAKQLALYVVIYSPLQMAADLPEHYEGNPAFQFIEDVAVDWERSLGLNGEIGNFVTIARKDRHSGDWYLGAITDEDPRTLTVALDFLDEGVRYRAEIYADGPKAHWRDNPEDYRIETRTVSAADSLELVLAAGGGTAIRFVPEE